MLQYDRDKRRRDLALAAVLDEEVADDRERDRANAVDLKVLHRVDQTDIEVAVELLGPVLAVDDDALDGHVHWRIESVRVERNRVDLVHHVVLLHIGVHHLVAGELEKLPQHADRHREAERNERQKQRRQTEREALASVEQVNQTEADRRDQKAVYRVQHGVPAGDDRVE